MKNRKPLAGYLPEEITDILDIHPSYRGRQIFEALWKGAESFSEITTLPKNIREKLEKDAVLLETAITDEKKEEGEDTVKAAILCKDRFIIEGVLLRQEQRRNTGCISTQAGCAMGCSFCMTGKIGLKRNLEVHEITEQVLHLQKRYGPLNSIVFMGMGEPLMNLERVRKAVAIFNHPLGLNMSLRRMTLSTCGIIEGLKEMADRGPHLRLALSLVAAEQTLREELMPIARKNPLPALKEALRKYQETTGKRITLEYVLLPGKNDGEEDAARLSSFCKGLSAIVNVIPWNPVAGMEYRSPSEGEIQAFLGRLSERKIPFTRRFRRGRGINGACGQLGGYSEDQFSC